ncbi:hypothetical protein [Actinoplanes aureus]|uniref:Secreted protein n=1 Tax=Actinoplanes aureus TaxID=2792083 RepID=A0A931CA01_9ACTN|nr:hypothetical protein [Actinoplanes aureus]MBG0564107.1 hypothetical protein [Actinoplanes aureus]
MLRSRSRALAMLSVTITASAVSVFATALPASAAEQSVYGVRGTVTPDIAQVCVQPSVAWGKVWYTESVVPGQEIGGSVMAFGGAGCWHKRPVSANSKFRSFHVCNSRGECGPEIRV